MNFTLAFQHKTYEKVQGLDKDQYNKEVKWIHFLIFCRPFLITQVSMV